MIPIVLRLSAIEAFKDCKDCLVRIREDGGSVHVDAEGNLESLKKCKRRRKKQLVVDSHVGRLTLTWETLEEAATGAERTGIIQDHETTSLS